MKLIIVADVKWEGALENDTIAQASRLGVISNIVRASINSVEGLGLWVQEVEVDSESAYDNQLRRKLVIFANRIITLVGRMRGCNELQVQQKRHVVHELIDEAEMFEQEAKEVL